MTGARGDALDWALALARAPGERLALRQRPLPKGIDSLLQIAAGHVSEELAAAVARTGETEANLIEAVRFYLREVLFHSGADAYRILGLERDASPDVAKAHHRWLQQWLHPDRHTSDWDAIFAGRVNAAWNQLRTEERRRAYDAEHPVVHAVPLAHVPPGMATWTHDSLPPQSQRQLWRGRAPLLALGVACAGLGILALRDIARDDTLVAVAPDATGQSGVDLERRGDAVLESFGNLHIPERVPALAAKAPPPRAPTARPPIPVFRQPDVAPGIDDRAASSPRLIAPAAAIAGAGREALPTRNQPATPPSVRSDPATPSTTLPSRASSGTTAAAPVNPPPSSAPTKTSPPPTSATPMTAIAIAETRKPPATAASPAAGTSATVKSPLVAAERVRQAQQVGDRLLAFMRRPSVSVPPIWDSLSAQQGAAQLREGLLADGSAGFSQAEWRVAERDAQMQVAIRYADGRTGRLNAGLVWREQRWLVSRLSMERDW